LRTRPQLKVLGSIVVANAVSMMNRFTIEQVPAKELLRHENVLKHIWMLACPRMIRNAQHDAAGLVA
jgi:hypothetical protein